MSDVDDADRLVGDRIAGELSDAVSPGATVFVVSSTVPPNLWDEFNTWYHEEHLPQAAAALGARAALRLADDTSPYIHRAVYILDGGRSVADVVGSGAGARLKAEYDGRWDGAVSRTWRTLSIKEVFGGQA